MYKLLDGSMSTDYGERGHTFQVCHPDHGCTLVMQLGRDVEPNWFRCREMVKPFEYLIVPWSSAKHIKCHWKMVNGQWTLFLSRSAVKPTPFTEESLRGG